MQPWPGERMKRSRSTHFGLLGLWRRCLCHSTYAMGACPIGAPGWPELAFCTASIDRQRIVLMQSKSRSEAVGTNVISYEILRVQILRSVGQHAGSARAPIAGTALSEGAPHNVRSLDQS